MSSVSGVMSIADDGGRVGAALQARAVRGPLARRRRAIDGGARARSRAPRVRFSPSGRRWRRVA